jgi:hypothetical protein
MISWYSISISLQSGNTIFNGYFSVDNTTNLVIAFYYENNFQKNILGPINTISRWTPGNYVFPNTTPYKFSFNGVNITNFPYYSNQGDTSKYYNLALDSEIWLSSQWQIGGAIPNPLYQSVIMIFNPISDPTIPIGNICFPAGMTIKTNKGKISIEKINPEIHTINNKPIVGITKTIFATDKYLIQFEKDSLGNNIPSKKTIISKNHKIFYNGKMIKANNFIGLNDKITKLNYRGEILYNVLMEEYDKMSVNNLICETLHPLNDIAKLYKVCKKLNIEEQQKLVKYYNDEYKKQKLQALV